MYIIETNSGCKFAIVEQLATVEKIFTTEGIRFERVKIDGTTTLKTDKNAPFRLRSLKNVN